MSKRLILLTIGLLMLFSLSAFATESRLAAMANSGMYLKDDAGIFMYPGTMSMYKKMIIAEHFTNSGVSSTNEPFSYGRYRRVGIIFPAWGSGTLAVFAGDGEEDFEVGSTSITEPTTRFLVGYGANTGNASLGAQVDFSGVREEFPSSVPQAGGASVFTASTWGIALGLSTPMGDLNNLDFGFRIRIGSFEEKDDTATVNAVSIKSDGNTTLSFVGRDYYALNDYVNLVPAAALGISTQKDIDFSGDTSRFKNSETVIEIGLALETKPSENSELIGGAGYRSSKFSFKELTHGFAGGADSLDYQLTDSHLPFAFLAFETQVKNWMHFRLGVEKSIDIFKEKQNGPAGLLPNAKLNESKQGGSSLEYAVGVGITAGAVTMDATVENDFFNEGPNFLSGETTSVGLFPRVTFTYNWK